MPVSEGSYLTDAERQALGLVGQRLLASQAMDPPGAVAAEGASVKDVALFTFMALGATLPQRLGLSVSRAAEDPSWVRVVASAGQEIEPAVPAGREHAVRRDPEDPRRFSSTWGGRRWRGFRTPRGRVWC